MAEPLGLIAGSGRFPQLLAEAARAKGVPVLAVAHVGETDPRLTGLVDELAWVRLGQLGAISGHFARWGVRQAVMAGGIGRVKSLTQARPDAKALVVLAGLRSTRDDELLRAIAAYFERTGVTIVSPTQLVPEVLAKPGHLAGPPLTEAQERDVAVGLEVASALGRADVGQTVAVLNGAVLAVEAIEGTDECLRRAGRYGGKGFVIVKRAKPGQDERFDLPAIGPSTLEVMREVGAAAIAVQARKTILLDTELLVKWADRLALTVIARDQL